MVDLATLVIIIFLPLAIVAITVAVAYAVYVSRVTSSGSTSNATTRPRDKVAFYSQCNFQGHQVNHGPEDLKDEYEIGLDRGSLRSVWVPHGMKVTLFTEQDFFGDRKILHKSTECLDDSWTQKTSSARVEKDSSGSTPAAASNRTRS